MKGPKKTQYGDYAKWLSFEVLAKYTIRLIFTEDLMKSAEGRLGQTPDRTADAFCFHVSNKGMSYIFLPMDAGEGTVAHEAWHIVHKVMEYVGVKDLDNEVVAYYLGHLVEKIYEFKNKITEKKHDKGTRGASVKAASKRRNR